MIRFGSSTEFTGSILPPQPETPPTPQINAALTIEAGTNRAQLSVDMGAEASTYIDGVLTLIDGSVIAEIHDYAVSPKLRELGVGQKLLRAFVAEAKASGAEDLWSDIAQNDLLGAHARALGEGALQFYDAQDELRQSQPITVAQAFTNNDRLISSSENNAVDSQAVSYGIYVNLKDIDTSGWCLPSITVEKYHPTTDFPELLVS